MALEEETLPQRIRHCDGREEADGAHDMNRKVFVYVDLAGVPHKVGALMGA